MQQTTGISTQTMLHVDKVDSLQTEPVHITADGLEASQCYKIQLLMHHGDGIHSSYCVIRSDLYGKIDLAEHKPLRGSYRDVNPMGLFLSLQPTESFRIASMIRDNVKEPTYYTLQLFNASGDRIDQRTIRKHWNHPLVSRIEVAQDGLFGTLFKPPGPGPFPCILDVPSVHGSIVERPSAVMASEGFLVFTFATYGYHRTLPQEICDMDVEFFEKPINFVRSLPYCSGKIGLYGLSFGATISGYLSIKYPGISAVVAVNGSECFFKYGLVMKENGKLMESVVLDEGAMKFVNGVGRLTEVIEEHYGRLTEEKRIPWRKARKETAFRIVASLDDWTISAAETARRIQKDLLEVGVSVELDLIPAGHFLNPPFVPHHSFVFNKFTRVSWGLGGEYLLHSTAEEEVWRKNIEFFKRHLGCPPKVPDWKRETKVAQKRDVYSRL